ncbi:hypothetical protein BESB_068540 [Besnoitia besnoiti]|uniref:Uncharacterized protein n=1 Tax=Besnoitia besnoiti TaxID=94643 RepID=A0A2A9MEY4_BESBE|nr:hypothetical protein BESB_068540 [Besnoitia besnoiti]PFH34821.1 hypothetical protein BESB_068540 [Besnoitia besnoiti]
MEQAALVAEAQKAAEEKRRQIEEDYPALSLLFRRMRNSLYLPQYLEVVSAIRADLESNSRRKATRAETPLGNAPDVGEVRDATQLETSASTSCDAPSVKSGEGGEGDGARIEPAGAGKEQRGRQQHAGKGGNGSCESPPERRATGGPAVTPDQAFWWLCANPPSFPFYEVYTQELIDALAGYLHGRICARLRPVEESGARVPQDAAPRPPLRRGGGGRGGGGRGGGGHGGGGRGGGGRGGGGRGESTLEKTGTARGRARARSPLRILEVGAGTGLLARHLTRALDARIAGDSPEGEGTAPPFAGAGAASASAAATFPASHDESALSGSGGEGAEDRGGDSQEQTSLERRGGRNRWYSYVASEARRDLACLYPAVAYGDFRDILPAYCPHICICSWMPFNIDWTETFRSFSRARQARSPRAAWQALSPLRDEGEGRDPEATERTQSCRDRSRADTRSRPSQSTATHISAHTEAPSRSPRSARAAERRAGEPSVTEQREAGDDTGVSEYILIGHAEFGLVGKSLETWGVRVPATVCLPQGVEFRRTDSCAESRLRSEDSRAPSSPRSKQRRCQDEGEQEPASTREGTSSHAPRSSPQRGRPTPASGRGTEGPLARDEGQRREARRERIEEKRPGPPRGETGSGEDARRVEGLRLTHALGAGGGLEGADSEPEEGLPELLPLAERQYWRDGYARVRLKGWDGEFQCSRFDAVESLASGGASSSRLSIFRKRRRR